MNYEYKEVYYDKYCETCKYADMDDTKDPCNECLGEPTNLHSHKPVKYKEDQNKIKEQRNNNEMEDKYE